MEAGCHLPFSRSHLRPYDSSVSPPSFREVFLTPQTAGIVNSENLDVSVKAPAPKAHPQ